MRMGFLWKEDVCNAVRRMMGDEKRAPEIRTRVEMVHPRKFTCSSHMQHNPEYTNMGGFKYTLITFLGLAYKLLMEEYHWWLYGVLTK
ncbi:hypothetical protein SUGI_1074770 [Cryptomeria japonica]|nr:hypothetical protein SUGI_1074770 [Cryptomeria japonica]